MSSDPDGRPLCNAVVAYVAVQRQLLVALTAPGADNSHIAAAMAAELDQLQAAVPAPAEHPGTLRPGDPGQ